METFNVAMKDGINLKITCEEYKLVGDTHRFTIPASQVKEVTHNQKLATFDKILHKPKL